MDEPPMSAIDNAWHRPATAAKLRPARSNCFRSIPAARSNIRSPSGNASGQCSARIAMYCAVQGPMPGSSIKLSNLFFDIRRKASTTRALRSPRARAPSGIVRGCRRCPSAPISVRQPRAMRAAVGASRLSSGQGVAMGSPKASAHRPAMVVAAFTDTCCPSTARTASSNPSNAPGTRRPGRRCTGGGEELILREQRSHRIRCGAEIEQCFTRTITAPITARTRAKLPDSSARPLSCSDTAIQPLASPIATVRR